jgi:tRNA 2-thiocytidine biosynthesis protein TtcA
MKIQLDHPLAVGIRKQMVQAISDFNMLEEGDHVMVCVSGGKDSSILLALMGEVQKRAPFNFTMEAVMLDQKQPGFDATAYQDWVQSLGIKLTILERDTYSIVKEKVISGTYCALCSRLRRGILYDHAVAGGFTKMALGHHRDDLAETLLLNLFYTGRMASMPPKLKSDNGQNILLRPLSYVPESELIELAKIWNFPVIPCNLCGSQEGMKRKKIKRLLRDLEKDIPHIGNSMLNAMSNIRPSQMLDQKLWDFDDLKADPIVIDGVASVMDPISGELTSSQAPLTSQQI